MSNPHLGNEVSVEILRQLGGNRFRAMTGARDFVTLTNGLQFAVPRTKTGVRKVRVTVDGNDLYTVDFYKVHTWKETLTATFTGVYAEDLQTRFTEQTGLYTTL